MARERLKSCPCVKCGFIIQSQDAICIGQLSAPEPHLGDFNTHRLCLHARADEDWHFKIQINRTDAWNLRRLLNEVFFKQEDKP